MPTSQLLTSILKSRLLRGLIGAVCLFLAVNGLVLPAAGQDFTLTMDKFLPASSVNPGGQATSNITLNPENGFTGTVTLGCTVTTTATDVAVFPECQVSQSTVAPPGSASAIVTSATDQGTATSASYTVTVTGTSGSLVHTASLTFTVLAVAPDFTITIATLVAPNSVPAGTGAQATISVNPINGYTGMVTLACSSITPVVVYPPICTFTYPSGQLGLPITAGPATTTLTINTLGPTPTGAVAQKRVFYAFWLPVPLALVSIGALGGRRARKSLALLALFVTMACVLLLPACNNYNSTTNTNTNVVTPANTYTITLTGVDQNGEVSSNSSTTNTAPTVSLTVTAPTNTQ
ncbi:MAG TPA: hypothetical protein VMH04_02645 [Candidatus Solibacter sp.]|nr:hypothetical protein [Candidatus Solibacter sp.]